MAHQTLEQELLALEKRYWQAQKDKDGAAAAELTDEACLIAGAQGVVEIDRRTVVGMMEEPVSIDAPDPSAWVQRDGR